MDFVNVSSESCESATESRFEDLLKMRDEHTMHGRNIQKLLLEAYTCLTLGNYSILWDLFECKSANLQYHSKVPRPTAKHENGKIKE